MDIQFLEKNPFFILDVLPTDKRTTIVSKADEKAFFLDADTCNEAQMSLLTPAKRLSAEMDWFCDCNATTISDIRSSIESHSLIHTDDLSGIARLNATLYNFVISDFEDYFEIGYAILDIDEQYSSIKTDALADTINTCHTEAGMLPVSDDEIGRGLNKKRDQIRHYISDKVLALSEDDYIEFVTILAEKCIANDDYSDGAIISDVVDQYELKMQTTIETASNEIITHIERICKIANKDGIKANLTGLIKRVKKWDRLVQPLQLRSMASGVAHQTSEDIGYKIRDFALWLHNEQRLTEQALMLVNSMKDIFAEIGSLADTFGEDIKTLDRIINKDKELKAIISEIEAVGMVVEKWKVPDENTNSYILTTNAITNKGVDELIAKVKALNEKIKAIDADEKIITQSRIALCATAREGVLYAHNEKQKTSLALYIAKILLSEFGDIAELQERLSKDIVALNSQLIATNSARHTYSPSYQSSSSNSNGKAKSGVIFVVIVFVIIIIAIASGNNRSTYSEQSSNSKPSYNQSSEATFSDDKPSYNQSSEVTFSDDKSSYNQSNEVKFSGSATAGTDVYADIVSISPAVGIYTQGASNYTYFVCECETSTGSTIWVHMSTLEYRYNFDINVSTSIYDDYQKVKTFSSKRIHGEARKADDVMSGLSSDTGAAMLIDFDSVG